jgi:hypothetical protein
MASRTSNEIGDALERNAAKILGGKRVVQSGGGKFWKCDITDGGRFIWSCKATGKDFIRVTSEMLREVVQAARGTKGTGNDYRHGIISEVDGKVYVTIPIQDFKDLITAPAGERAYVEPTKGAERRAQGRRSLLG